MSYAARSAWTLAGLLALAAGIGAHFWMRPASDGVRVRAPAAGGSLFAIHSAPRPMVPLAFEDGNGRKLTLADFHDKVILLNVWATWCLPCREEMPALDRLQQKLSGRGFEVIALSIDSDGAPAVRRFYAETGVRSLAVYIDPGMRATSNLHVVGVPTTLLIDRKGREIGRHTGPAQWDARDAVQSIRAHMELQ